MREEDFRVTQTNQIGNNIAIDINNVFTQIRDFNFRWKDGDSHGRFTIEQDLR